jgi:hypothetical protein
MMTMFELVTPLLPTPFDAGLLQSAITPARAIGRVHHAH